MKYHRRSSKRKLKVYRSRVKRSTCRKSRKNKGSCRSKPRCKLARGTKRHYCRKRTNRHVRKT